MVDTTGTERCQMVCRSVAGVVALLALILMAAVWGWSVFLSLVLAVVIGAALWFGLPKLVCEGEGAAPPSGAAAPPPGRAASDPRPAGPGSSVAGREEPSSPVGATEAETPSEPAPAAPESPAAPLPQEPVGASEPEAAPEPAPGPAPGPAAEPTPETAAPQSAAMEEVPEGAEEKPETLSEARAGGADDLRRIRGIGPKLEQTLNGMGIYHYDQIASWSPREVAWVDRNLEGFRGRVTRDDWVSQARALLQA